jgi:hypothetical protein
MAALLLESGSAMYGDGVDLILRIFPGLRERKRLALIQPEFDIANALQGGRGMTLFFSVAASIIFQYGKGI